MEEGSKRVGLVLVGAIGVGAPIIFGAGIPLAERIQEHSAEMYGSLASNAPAIAEKINGTEGLEAGLICLSAFALTYIANKVAEPVVRGLAYLTKTDLRCYDDQFL